MTDGVLSDLRVIELSQGIAGPYCGKLLAEYGADVIKVEPPSGGDVSRRLGPFPDDIPHPEKSGLFLHLNTGKKSLTLDVATDSGTLILKQLLANTDVLVESYAPGQMSQWGLGYDDLKEEFPSLIYVSITPFGQTGPYRDYKGNSLTAMATSGVMCLTGEPDREPLTIGGEPAEYLAGLQAWVAALAALAYRDQERTGQHVDVSLMESAATADESITVTYSFMGVVRRRFHSRHLWGYPQDLLPCKDGHVLVHPGSRGFPRPIEGEGASPMSLLLGDVELDLNPLFTERWQRWFRWRDFDRLLEPYLSTHTADEVVDFAQALRMPFARVFDVAQLLESQHLKERGFFKDLEHPEAGRLRHTGELFRMSESPWQLGRAPTLGEHNESILAGELGHRKEDLAVLHDGASSRSGDVPELPLEGVRVLDLSQVWAGPTCTSILASLGAYVIKVEGMTRVDVSHSILPVDNDPGDDPWNAGPYYFCHNAGKRGITVNLLEERGIELFKRLLPACDVLVEAFSPRVMRNFGLTYDALRQTRPDLIMISMSGYGQTGLHSGYTAYGMGLEGASGISSITGYRDGPPTRSGISFTDPVAGIAAAGAVLLALRHRERTGQGQYIDMSQQEAALPLMGAAFMEYQMTGRLPGRRGNRSPVAAPQGCYRCQGDDDWLVVSVSNDDEWASFCDAIGHPAWRDDERFATVLARHENHDALDTLIGDWTQERDHIEAFHLLQRAGVKAAPVLNGKEMLQDPHLRERQHFDILDHRHLGPRPIPRHLVAKFDRMDPKPDRAAPTLGEHNAEVLQGLAGLSSQEIADMEAQQIIGTAPLLEVPLDWLKGLLTFPLDLMLQQGALRDVEEDYLEQLGLGGAEPSH